MSFAGLMGAPGDMYGSRALTASPGHRSKLAAIFGASERTTTPGHDGFVTSADGQAKLTPRAAIPGTYLQPHSPRDYGSAFDRTAASPRALAAAAANMRYGSPRSERSRAEHMQREAEIRQRAAEAQQRIMYSQNKEKMKKFMRTLADSKDELPVPELMEAAKLAGVPLHQEHQTLLFQTPYANRYASTWDQESPRSAYGLECSPRSVKWRAFEAALQHGRMMPQSVEAQLQKYAQKEADTIAKIKAEQERANQIAAKAAQTRGESVAPVRTISDEQLKMIHKTVKTRLATKFSNVKEIFKSMDMDRSGTISPEECVDGLMTLNVGLPRKFVEHLINVADYNRDGELSYTEFTQLLECDDITKFNPGANMDGLAVKDASADIWKPGIKKSELRNAQAKIKDMLEERGGITKMFRIIDEDKSGWCSRKELRMLMVHLNLETVVRPPILEELMNLMDVDGDDQIRYNEFARICAPGAMGDLFDISPEERAMLAVKEAEPVKEKKKGAEKKRR